MKRSPKRPRPIAARKRILAGHDPRRRPLRPYVAFVGLGSNHDAEQQVQRAIEHPARRVKLLAVSTIYRTPAARGSNAGWFCNTMVAIQTRMPPQCLPTLLLKPIERALGRHGFTEDKKRVPIDLDLIMTAKPESSGRGMDCHPTVRTQAYVAVPLLEIAGDNFLDDHESLAKAVAGLDTAGLFPLAGLTERVRRRHRLLAEATT